MIEIKATLRKWGNSFGIIVPQKALINESVKEGDEIEIIISKGKNVLRETFGTLKTKKTTERIMKEIDDKLDSEL